MKFFLVAFFAFTLNLPADSQNLQKFIDKLDHLVTLVPRHISMKEPCDKLIRDLDDLSDDIEDELKDGDDLNPDEIQKLKATLKNTEALEDFVRAVGNSSFGTGFLKEGQLSLVRDMLNFSMTEIYAGKFCVNIYQIILGAYSSLLVTKVGSTSIVRIKATIKSTRVNARTTLELGVVPREYSRFWSGANDANYSSYQIIRIECTATGNNGFNF